MRDSYSKKNVLSYQSGAARHKIKCMLQMASVHSDIFHFIKIILYNMGSESRWGSSPDFDYLNTKKIIKATDEDIWHIFLSFKLDQPHGTNKS